MLHGCCTALLMEESCCAEAQIEPVATSFQPNMQARPELNNPACYVNKTHATTNTIHSCIYDALLGLIQLKLRELQKHAARVTARTWRMSFLHSASERRCRTHLAPAAISSLSLLHRSRFDCAIVLAAAPLCTALRSLCAPVAARRCNS